jgi:hypothetical protein
MSSLQHSIDSNRAWAKRNLANLVVHTDLIGLSDNWLRHVQDVRERHDEQVGSPDLVRASYTLALGAPLA